MLEKVKLSLRIKSDAFNTEISEMIEAAKLDLSISGVEKINEDDPLIQQAIKTYCKANFGLDNKDSEKYQKSYNMLKEHLSLCGDYNVG
ncbi:head-tail connector protein [Clostridium perfringens]|uniref:head-tail connector protein n=1 Tax=Clostridium perfringens TaxID=1502 RepID=UPI0013E3CD68|nr:head-tail connector protein [Clostridium perfringens]MCX0363213.1 head-tail connector protein [Clostridium perfringens]MCX0373035.1 head-tail connector protein [Clostridium perfringens]MDU7067606.1 head-tail connector protein [Clostridium perfringens]NGT54735.1 DNA-packaging protein [Clostridium perfringens]NGT94703.1 DNA-packaging protein [Clostridium perfringens]